MSRPASSSTSNNSGNGTLIQELQHTLDQYTHAGFSEHAASFLDENAAAMKEAARLITRIILTRFTTLPVMSMDAEALYQTATELSGMDLGQPPATYIDNGYVLIKGSGILAELFGDHYGSTVNAVSITTHIKSSSVHTLMCLFAAFVFHELGIITKQQQINQQQLLAQMRLCYPMAVKELPEQLLPFLDWIKPANNPFPEDPIPQTIIIRTPNQTSSQRWIMTISLLLLAVMLVILLIRSRKTSTTPVSGSARDAVQVVGIRQEEME